MELLNEKFRPFKNYEELVKFWANHYQTEFRPAFAMPLIWVKNIVDEHICLIAGYGNTEEGNSSVLINGLEWTMLELKESFLFLDGSQCGIKE